MGAVAKTFTAICAAAGLAALSQMPEFAQQYAQRLGGAISELRVIVSDFDRDADNSQLTREEALDQMLGSPTKFARDRGASMNRTITRYYLLARQKFEMENADPLMKPLFMLQTPDANLVEGTWNDFRPGLQITSTGAVYAGVGALIGIAIARLIVGMLRACWRGASGAARLLRERSTVGGVRVDRTRGR
ncbi:MAG: DUF2937 family protein [Nitratireductor sp.]|jgi:hypothetical protein|nr:DUF2937 family protein [Nitratireductor sp.]